ncbi:MAG: hypothetical protein V4441_04190 [Pseudomonadota bacterium]
MRVQLLEAESAGKIIQVNKDGVPEAVEPPPPTEEQLWAAVRTTRDSLIEGIAWRYERHAREVRLNLLPTDSLEALDLYTQSLAEITNQPSPANIVWPILLPKA